MFGVGPGKERKVGDGSKCYGGLLHNGKRLEGCWMHPEIGERNPAIQRVVRN